VAARDDHERGPQSGPIAQPVSGRARAAPRDDRDDADPADIAADRLDGRAGAERVASALRELPEKDAALITLVAIDELPVAVAATALHLSPGAARTRLHRIRKRLSGVLAELEASEEVSRVDS
jgi:RNA polymerase sigma-70 factor (ECF subfamily)